MRDNWHYTEEGGMAALDVTAEDNHFYVEVVSYGWHEDQRALLKMSKEDMRELLEWLKAKYEDKP